MISTILHSRHFLASLRVPGHRNRFLALACIIGFLLVAGSAAKANCIDVPLLTVDTKEEGDGVILFIPQPLVLDATITSHLTLENLASPMGQDFTIDLHQYTDRSRPFVFERVKVIDPAKGYKYNVDYKYRVGNLNGRPDMTYIYQLPYRPGEVHMVTQSYFGDFSHQRGTDEEYAVDFDMPIGTPVLAARDGIVVEVVTASDQGGAEAKYKKCRNEVAIRHADGSYAVYAHLSHNGSVVRVGDRVAAGDLIAYSGATGFCSGPHLHFCLFVSTSGTSCKSFPVIFRTRFGDLPKLEPQFVF